MNSKWQIHRVGLVDFWYYDEEEFYFRDGRMLLRGANGSGKSVTMQSFIPLLLDGNMRPERLDPFGSRARKMDNYLLEEDDPREERTGYLFMELKREESDTYLSLGIGMRARKNKKLDSWYFCITDGRRIGKDIFLYKDLKNKIACTRIELRNRIGEGGRVMETQGEYAQCVNKYLFGFETMEEYKEMLELLIQLRTPKLSKDFKPTVINDILSNSLQTLSEDDLRPMSEAIENMDNLKTNLDNLNDSVKAARQIERVYHQYNEIVLYDKALLFSQEGKECRRYIKRAQELTEQIQRKASALEKETEHYQELLRENTVLLKERESLAESDAVKLKEQEIKTMQKLQEEEQEVSGKEKQEQEKTEKQRQGEEKLKRQQEQNEILWEDISENLKEMAMEMEDIPFDEATFFQKEFCEHKEESFSFQAHNQLLAEYTKKVLAGKDILEKEKQAQEKYSICLKELDDCREKRNQAEREEQQYGTLLHEIKGELIEQIYRWAQENTELSVDSEALQEIHRRVEGYQMGTDYSEIRDLAKPFFYQRERVLTSEAHSTEQKLQEIMHRRDEIYQELEEWQKQKDPEPEQNEAIKANRRLLLEKGIPHEQFYKTVDFDSRLNDEQMSLLEEALLQMGILDALIVPGEYREAIRMLDPGVCDKYIFSDVSHVKENLLEMLDVDNGENDILRFQNISHILSSIGYHREASDAVSEAADTTWVDEMGNYRLGVLEGTITKTYKARFIGVRARENYRQQKIAELTSLLSDVEKELSAYNGQLKQLQQQLAILTDEWNAFPEETDLKVAAKAYAQKEYVLELQNEQLHTLQERCEKERRQLESIRFQVREICQKCYLPARLDIVEEALKGLQNYRGLLTQVQIAHGTYINGVQYIKSQKEYLEELEGDLDDIRYELNRALQKSRETRAALHSIQEQLKITDYEEMKERLDACIRRLNALPLEREASIRYQTDLAKESEKLQEQRTENELLLQKSLEKKQRLERAFEAEYALGYVAKNETQRDDAEEQASRICTMLSGKFGNKKQSDLLGSLQEVYHQNRGYLLEYHLTMETLFSEMDEETSVFAMAMKRIDISAKYRGTSLRFYELIEKISADAEEQKRLLSDKDRELFEDILANTISKKIRGKIQASKRWVDKMNMLMESMQTSSGLTLSLRWKNKRAEKEEQLDTRKLVELLQKDVEIMRIEEVEQLSAHFRSKIEEARKLSADTNSVWSFHGIMKEVLDYRKWFEFQLECQKTGEKKKELTDRVFFTFSGGEKAMAMYVPLFSAVVAKYAGARPDAPKLISLDEAFAGVDETNIRDMFRLMVEFNFNFMINSQILWGDYDTVPGLAIYQLVRPENAKYVTVIPYMWNGKVRSLAPLEKEGSKT